MEVSGQVAESEPNTNIAAIIGALHIYQPGLLPGSDNWHIIVCAIQEPSICFYIFTIIK